VTCRSARRATGTQTSAFGARVKVKSETCSPEALKTFESIPSSFSLIEGVR
jgi:hypothetical protein